MQWVERILRFEGVLTLVIATLGTFAVMYLWMRAMLPELAVRRAIGASRRAIAALVLRRAGVVAVAGVAISLWLGELVSGTLAGIVADLPRRDMTVLLRPTLLLVAAAFAGALLPAWQATRVDPARVSGGMEP